jgi:hypothetical protein
MGRDPYEVLGIDPTATLAEAEDAYHARMRREHPDLHHGAGPERVAEAERRTRELTSAISTIRDDRTIRADVRTGTPGATPGSGDQPGWATSDGSGPTWSDTPPEPEVSTAACPWCGQRFARATELKDHVFDEHDLRVDRRRRGGLFGGRIHRMTQAATHLPLWGVIPINLALATVIGVGVAGVTDETVGGWAAAITMTPSVAALIDRLFDLVR